MKKPWLIALAALLVRLLAVGAILLLLVVPPEGAQPLAVQACLDVLRLYGW